jgi:putative ABC transport system ATP-binding protein
MIPLLHGRGLTRAFGRTPALRGVDVIVGEGEILAVTGPAGSGKSTALRCLAGILRPDAGEVIYRGLPVHAWSASRRADLRRTDFGLVVRGGQLVPELTAAENVALPLLVAGARRQRARAAAVSWLERMGVGDLADSCPPALSGGQQQRCAVARAMVTDPTVLFADEPAGALDRRTGEGLLAVMMRVARERRIGVLLVTRDPRVAAYADRAMVLVDGAEDPYRAGARLVPA